MDYLSIALDHWIDNRSLSELDSLPWMNSRLKAEEIAFWIENGFLDKNLNKTGKKLCAKLIFLDIDGVLNHSESNDAIDGECLNNLAEIVKGTGAHVILISSWKCGWNKIGKNKQDEDGNYLDERFKEVGIKIFDKTSRYAGGRTIEVVDWIMKFNSDSYIILDDDSGHYSDTKLEEHFIHTSYYDGGLKRKMISTAISLLK